MPRRIALATSSRVPDLMPEDRLLRDALASERLDSEAVVWDGPGGWDGYDGVLVRCCWDYHERLDDFFAWIAMLERRGIPLWNPPATIRWNARKTYLRELEASGIATVPTRWALDGEGLSLAQLLEDGGWTEAVVKPVVSAGAIRTWRTSPATARAEEAAFRELVADCGAMVQPFLPEVVADGEWSLLFMDGRFSHAVVKRAAPGDYRVQAQFGGTAESLSPPAYLRRAAEMALAAATALSTPDGDAGEARDGGTPLYARVDGCAVAGTFRVMEVELIEPVLFLEHDEAAAGRLASALRARVEARE